MSWCDMEVKGQCVGISRLLPCGSNSGIQVWQQVLVPSEPSELGRNTEASRRPVEETYRRGRHGEGAPDFRGSGSGEALAVGGAVGVERGSWGRSQEEEAATTLLLRSAFWTQSHRLLREA